LIQLGATHHQAVSTRIECDCRHSSLVPPHHYPRPPQGLHTLSSWLYHALMPLAASSGCSRGQARLSPRFLPVLKMDWHSQLPFHIATSLDSRTDFTRWVVSLPLCLFCGSGGGHHTPLAQSTALTTSVWGWIVPQTASESPIQHTIKNQHCPPSGQTKQEAHVPPLISLLKKPRPRQRPTHRNIPNSSPSASVPNKASRPHILFSESANTRVHRTNNFFTPVFF